MPEHKVILVKTSNIMQQNEKRIKMKVEFDF